MAGVVPGSEPSTPNSDHDASIPSVVPKTTLLPFRADQSLHEPPSVGSDGSVESAPLAAVPVQTAVEMKLLGLGAPGPPFSL